MAKSLLVFGGNGFVGSAICKYALSQSISVFALSRSGRPKHPEPWQSPITYLKGDALDPSTYQHLLPSISAVVHSVGTLFDSRTPLNIRNVYQGSYEQMNRDTAFKICEVIENKNIPFIYISAERGMFFSPRYLSTKREVEVFLLNNPDKLPSTIIRPGFMYSKDSNALKGIACGIDALNLPDKVFKGVGAGWLSQTFIPSRSLDVELVAKVSVISCFDSAFRSRVIDVDEIENTAKTYNSL